MAKQGIEKIKIPVEPKANLGIDDVKAYLPIVYKKFKENAKKIEDAYNFYCLDHPILLKQRAYQDTNINNIVLIPSLRSSIDWKVAYELGNPIKYSQNKVEETDEMDYLNIYIKDSIKRSVDSQVATWAFATGVGYYYIVPKSESINSEKQSPFELYCFPANSCAKIYSSYVGEKPLFDMFVSKLDVVDEDNNIKEYNIVELYFSDTIYRYKLEGLLDNFNTTPTNETRGMSKPLPLVEKRCNPDGIGIVALAQRLQITLDELLSNGLDNIQETVNEIFVYKNVDLGKTPEDRAEKHREMKKSGAIVLKSSSKEFPADIDTLKPNMSMSELITFFDTINEQFHAVIGVPLETSNTNSGGTTKSGSEVANGYDNAYNKALLDINNFNDADTELLEKILWICKNGATPIKSLYTSEIEIMYNINLSDNIQTKAQAYSLLAPYLPPDMILRVVKMSNDAKTDGEAIKKYMKEMAEREKNDTEVIENNSERTLENAKDSEV